MQLLAYNKKEIHQYGVCYLHVKSKNCVKLCKFYVVDSKFNPIIGVNSACHLGLLKFTEPVFENWTDTTPISSPELNVDIVGKTSRNLSDAISRLSVHDSDAAKNKVKPIADFNISIHEISKITGFKSLTLQDIKEETIKDCQLTKLKTCIVDGFPKHKHECAEDICSFFDYRESLTITDGMIMKDKRIVIPPGLCEQALENLYRSHMGIVKTKERAVPVCFGQRFTMTLKTFFPGVTHACLTKSNKPPSL